MAQIREINDQWWVHEFAEWELERLWNSFGSRLPVVAEKNWDDFIKSYEAGAELHNIEATRHLQDAFAQDVKAIAKRYMAENQQYVEEEAAELNEGGDLNRVMMKSIKRHGKAKKFTF